MAAAPSVLRGTPVVPGVAYGPVAPVCAEVSAEAVERFGDGGFADTEAALAAYDVATAQVAEGFARKATRASGAAAEVLTASAGLARDKGLRGAVRKHLGSGDDLLASVRAAVDQFASVFTQMGGLMAERVTDLHDIERRLTAVIVGEPEPGVPTPDRPSILVAEDLAPSDAAGLDPELVLAIVTERGGPTSHTAIIARQLGIPCVVGTAGAAALPDGLPVLVDGAQGLARTADGRPVELLANVADVESARLAAAAPVEGVGLFRTELSFLNRGDEPSVEEQAALYTGVLTAFRDRGHVVVRTLDAGSDKPIAFATHVGEENPALGVRGLRLSFDNPGLLDRQLDAIAVAARDSGADTWVMAPMVATAGEAADFAGRVRERGLRAGVMVEVPSAVLTAGRILEEVDFLSIGTNDLTQYTMAADRMATDLAHLTDPWQPAVLQLVEMTARAGAVAGKPVGICGEAAADPLLACVLVGMGVTSLSMAAAAVRPVGARLGTVSLERCAEAAQAALGAADPMAARAAALAVVG